MGFLGGTNGKASTCQYKCICYVYVYIFLIQMKEWNSCQVFQQMGLVWWMSQTAVDSDTEVSKLLPPPGLYRPKEN